LLNEVFVMKRAISATSHSSRRFPKSRLGGSPAAPRRRTSPLPASFDDRDDALYRELADRVVRGGRIRGELL
jgi:hypothetical protein